MLATNINHNAYSQSIMLSNNTDSNSYMGSIKDTDYASNESFKLSDNKFDNSLVKLIFLLCFISAYYSSDSVSSSAAVPLDRRLGERRRSRHDPA